MWRIHFLTITIGSVCSLAADTPQSRLLLIGIDGCRPDAISAAQTPNLDTLIKEGAFTNRTQILGERYQENDTISGPGWSSFLTGVWADKHGVHDNSFEGKNYGKYPHLFHYIKQVYPSARTGSFVNWEPIDTHIVDQADTDVRVVHPAKGAEDYMAKDIVIAREAVQFLSNGEPHVAMVYFGAVDETGHSHGFHPSVPPYIAAIEKVDGHIGELIQALKNRPNYDDENWLIVVSTDHGGKDKGHGDGHTVPEIRTTFMIVSGSGAKPGIITQPTFVVDVPVTGLVHLGIPVKPEWQLDGQAAGLKMVPQPDAVKTR